MYRSGKWAHLLSGGSAKAKISNDIAVFGRMRNRTWQELPCAQDPGPTDGFEPQLIEDHQAK